MNEGVAQSKPCIMVVVDDPGILELLTLWLENAGYRVVAGNSGEQALRLFVDNHPDLSIVDLCMRGMDRFHVISRMREMSDAPALILSALDDEDTVVRALTLGGRRVPGEARFPEELHCQSPGDLAAGETAAGGDGFRLCR
jgi:CheY-like chemotaxis protein